VLRGNHSVKMDEKGRIKIPSTFRRYIEEHYSAEFYVTSLTGENVRLYPMPEWLNIEEKLKSHGTMNPAVRKFLDRTNYYGQMGDMDQQGRILIHPALRSSSGLIGEVSVLGYLQYMEVWATERFQSRLEGQPYTDDDAAEMARLGI
jgi:MraZ protein